MTGLLELPEITGQIRSDVPLAPLTWFRANFGGKPRDRLQAARTAR